MRVVLTITNGALQEVRKGFTWGEVTIVPLLEEEEEDAGAAPAFTLPVRADDKLVIPFQNENLYAYIEGADGAKKVCLCPGHHIRFERDVDVAFAYPPPCRST